MVRRFLALIGFLLVGASAISAQAPVPQCEIREGEAIPLSALWEEARALERGYAAADEAVAAEEAGRSAVRREWLPRLSLDGVGDYGQRLSPGEERVLGVGPRGELRARGTWTVLDGTRRARARAAGLRGAEADLLRAEFDAAYRAELARIYAEAALAEEVWQLREEQHAELEALAAPVRRRMEAGVDVTWEGHLLDEALARSERWLAEAGQARAAARSDLSSLVGRCVFAQPIEPWAGRPEEARVENPSVLRMMRLADTHDALADVERGLGRWQLQLFGLTGPNHSRAFDDGRVENEYLAGLSASWAPDLFGVRGRLAEAERARARSIRAEAAGQQALVEREIERLAVELEHAEGRGEGLARELDRTRRRLQTAIARWEAGVDRWAEVIAAIERVQETRLLQVDLMREIAIARIRVAEAGGNIEAVLRGLGQEREP